MQLNAVQVACTALGVNHCLLKGRVFDMCIVDEAGQMTLPVALGPILHSKYGLLQPVLVNSQASHIPCIFIVACGAKKSGFIQEHRFAYPGAVIH